MLSHWQQLPSQKLATTLQTHFNAVNTLLGVGILTVPYAIAQGGWTAVFLLILIGFVTNYTGKLLWDLQRGLYHDKPTTLPDIPGETSKAVTVGLVSSNANTSAQSKVTAMAQVRISMILAITSISVGTTSRDSVTCGILCSMCHSMIFFSIRFV